MSGDKLKLPDSIAKSVLSNAESCVSDSVYTEVLKTKRSEINSKAKVEVAKLQVAKEAISATRSFFDVLKSHTELKITIAKWEGRVNEAEELVKKAQYQLEKCREDNKSRMEELKGWREAQDRLLWLFDEVLKQATDPELSEEVRKEARQYLLQLSDRIVQLKK